jgi:hypothetical protein
MEVSYVLHVWVRFKTLNQYRELTYLLYLLSISSHFFYLSWEYKNQKLKL